LERSPTLIDHPSRMIAGLRMLIEYPEDDRLVGEEEADG
jgi:hypothetical protein